MNLFTRCAAILIATFQASGQGHGLFFNHKIEEDVIPAAETIVREAVDQFL